MVAFDQMAKVLSFLEEFLKAYKDRTKAYRERTEQIHRDRPE